jgi:hypothetical protein
MDDVQRVTVQEKDDLLGEQRALRGRAMARVYGSTGKNDGRAQPWPPT